MTLTTTAFLYAVGGVALGLLIAALIIGWIELALFVERRANTKCPTCGLRYGAWGIKRPCKISRPGFTYHAAGKRFDTLYAASLYLQQRAKKEKSK